MRRLVLETLVLLAAASGLVAAQHDVIALHDAANWRLDNARGFGNVSDVPVNLPVSALQALQQAGLVGDPLWR